ncbi:unnamed protein product [Dibothriocephalus latus]|uniref:Uncharacterized protein n=1 Tax=Dibothriocephalus latus TaxID=60516 RepID=A0A3P7NXR5_DIBLA|nr:unnamed protein product [Dibothriocephalus latus]
MRERLPKKLVLSSHDEFVLVHSRENPFDGFTNIIGLTTMTIDTVNATGVSVNGYWVFRLHQQYKVLPIEETIRHCSPVCWSWLSHWFASFGSSPAFFDECGRVSIYREQFPQELDLGRLVGWFAAMGFYSMM